MWLLSFYTVILVGIMVLPFRRELKAVWVLALTVDALISTSENVAFHLLGCGALLAWLVSYF
jgi:hypothetical protein